MPSEVGEELQDMQRSCSVVCEYLAFQFHVSFVLPFRGRDMTEENGVAVESCEPRQAV